MNRSLFPLSKKSSTPTDQGQRVNPSLHNTGLCLTVQHPYKINPRCFYLWQKRELAGKGRLRDGERDWQRFGKYAVRIFMSFFLYTSGFLTLKRKITPNSLLSLRGLGIPN